MFCPHCGSPVEELPGAPAAGESEAVVLARIEMDKAIELAKIARRTELDYNETRIEVAGIEAEAEVGAAEATAEVVAAVIESGGNDDGGDQGPVIIDAPEAIAEDEPDDAPPEVEGSEPPEPKSKSAGIGFW